MYFIRKLFGGNNYNKSIKEMKSFLTALNNNECPNILKYNLYGFEDKLSDEYVILYSCSVDSNKNVFTYDYELVEKHVICPINRKPIDFYTVIQPRYISDDESNKIFSKFGAYVRTQIKPINKALNYNLWLYLSTFGIAAFIFWIYIDYIEAKFHLLHKNIEMDKHTTELNLQYMKCDLIKNIIVVERNLLESINVKILNLENLIKSVDNDVDNLILYKKRWY